jgi:succinoglycan biosynthesis protein ExoM
MGAPGLPNPEVEVKGSVTSSGAGGGPAVVVAMLTYLRTTDLPEAVEAVRAAIGSGTAAGRADLLVIDNDPEGSAMALADRWPDVRFVHEPVPGIAAARNRALDEAAGHDLLVFIDDDERPQAGWLSALLETWLSTEPAAVVGPVVSTFAVEPGTWIGQGGFFTRRRLPTETQVSVAATNNLLLDLRWVNRLDLRFDLAFGATGGSDTLFARQLHRAGGRIVWCDEAVVTDVVPPSRATRGWVLRRALRSGNSWSRVAVALEEGAGSRIRRRVQLSAAGMARVVGGGARILLGVLARSTRHRAAGAKTLARGVGMASGAWGYTYAEYRRPRP